MMSEQNKYQFPTLEPDDIEVKVKQVGEKGTSVLLYKTSRTDMRYLDEAYGVNNWQVDYQMIGDMLFCTISVWDDDKKQWIRKQSNGIPSREDGEGNEVKGQASDAMKRSGFLFGIGRELYSAPFTFISSSKLPTKQDKNNPKRWVLEDQFTKFAVSDIGYDNKRKINRLVIINQKTGDVLYSYNGSSMQKNAKNAPKKEEPKQEAPKPVAKPVEKPIEAPNAEEQTKLQQKVNNAIPPKATVEVTDTIPKEKAQHELLCESFIKRHNITKIKFAEWRANAVKAGKDISAKRWADLSEDEWVTLLATMEALYEEGFFKGVA